MDKIENRKLRREMSRNSSFSQDSANNYPDRLPMVIDDFEKSDLLENGMRPKKMKKEFVNFSSLGDNAIEKLFKNNTPTITVQM